VQALAEIGEEIETRPPLINLDRRTLAHLGTVSPSQPAPSPGGGLTWGATAAIFFL
jgi:hypothetical protein